MTFGYGDAVCPDCYTGEQPFLFFDDRFWLNRFLMRFVAGSSSRSELKIEDPALDQLPVRQPEIEAVG